MPGQAFKILFRDQIEARMYCQGNGQNEQYELYEYVPGVMIAQVEFQEIRSVMYGHNYTCDKQYYEGRNTYRLIPGFEILNDIKIISLYGGRKEPNGKN